MTNSALKYNLQNSEEHQQFLSPDFVINPFYFEHIDSSKLLDFFEIAVNDFAVPLIDMVKSDLPDFHIPRSNSSFTSGLSGLNKSLTDLLKNALQSIKSSYHTRTLSRRLSMREKISAFREVIASDPNSEELYRLIDSYLKLCIDEAIDKFRRNVPDELLSQISSKYILAHEKWISSHRRSAVMDVINTRYQNDYIVNPWKSGSGNKQFPIHLFEQSLRHFAEKELAPKLASIILHPEILDDPSSKSNKIVIESRYSDIVNALLTGTTNPLCLLEQLKFLKEYRQNEQSMATSKSKGSKQHQFYKCIHDKKASDADKSTIETLTKFSGLSGFEECYMMPIRGDFLKEISSSYTSFLKYANDPKNRVFIKVADRTTSIPCNLSDERILVEEGDAIIVKEVGKTTYEGTDIPRSIFKYSVASDSDFAFIPVKLFKEFANIIKSYDFDKNPGFTFIAKELAYNFRHIAMRARGKSLTPRPDMSKQIHLADRITQTTDIAKLMSQAAISKM